MKNPKISVIMIDGSFRESFHAIDFFCSQTLSPDEYEVIWVEFYDKVHPEIEAKKEKYPHFRVITLGNPQDKMYHSSFVFNKGIVEADADLLFIPDGDIAVEKNFLEEAYKEHRQNDKLVMYFYRSEEPEGKHIVPPTIEHLMKVCQFKNPSNYGGCLSVRKKWLLEINGYEQHPVFGSGFHANGLDMYTRLKILGLHIMWHPDLILYHPWHPFNGAGFPVWAVQKTFPEYRSKNFIYKAFQGIDPTRNFELHKELIKKLDIAKQHHKLDVVFDKWYNMKVDPSNTNSELFYKQNS